MQKKAHGWRRSVVIGPRTFSYIGVCRAVLIRADGLSGVSESTVETDGQSTPATRSSSVSDTSARSPSAICGVCSTGTRSLSRQRTGPNMAPLLAGRHGHLDEVHTLVTSALDPDEVSSHSIAAQSVHDSNRVPDLRGPTALL